MHVFNRPIEYDLCNWIDLKTQFFCMMYFPFRYLILWRVHLSYLWLGVRYSNVFKTDWLYTRKVYICIAYLKDTGIGIERTWLGFSKVAHYMFDSFFPFFSSFFVN